MNRSESDKKKKKTKSILNQNIIELFRIQKGQKSRVYVCQGNLWMEKVCAYFSLIFETSKNHLKSFPYYVCSISKNFLIIIFI